MSTVDEITTPLTYQEIRLAIYNVIAATGATTTTWKPGAIMRTFISAVAIVLSAMSGLIALLARSAFLPLATGEWLRLIAFYVYRVTRIEAAFATGFVTLTNTSGAIYTLDPGDLTIRNPITRKLYTNVALITLAATSTLTGVAVVSLEVGSAATSYGGEITEMVTSLTGVTVANPSPVIGSDVESDPALRLRCLEKLGALSPNGPSDAYGYIARSATRADGSAIGVTRVRALPDGHGTVNCYVASATGAVLGTVGDLASDLGLVDDALQRNVVPLCVKLVTQTATPRVIPITYSAWLYNTSGLTTAEIQTVIAAELAAYFAVAPIGGNIIDGGAGAIFYSEITAVIGRARTPQGAPLPIVRVDLTLPGSDVVVATGEVPVLGPVSGSIAQITPVGL